MLSRLLCSSDTLCAYLMLKIFRKDYDSCIGQCRWNEPEETETSLGPLNQLKD